MGKVKFYAGDESKEYQVRASDSSGRDTQVTVIADSFEQVEEVLEDNLKNYRLEDAGDIVELGDSCERDRDSD